MSELIDLTGQKFGRWLVISRGEDYVSPRGYHLSKWKCECGCGTERDVIGNHLKRGISKSCGCLQKERASKLHFQDLTGQKFGRLIVIRRAEDYVRPSGGKTPQWLCQCDCGNTVIVLASSLRSGRTKSCGCYNKERTVETHLIDLVGERFGRLVVVERVDNKIYNNTSAVAWECKCDCGNVVEVTGQTLRIGSTKSCGCLQLESIAKGKDHWNWQGGISSIVNSVRTSTKYKEWQMAVFERDNYTCQYSGETGIVLNIHHIKPFSIILEENHITTVEEAYECEELWNINNGVTLAEKWHLGEKTLNDLAFHKLYGKSGCTSKDFLKWFMVITPEFAKELGI